MSCQQNVSLQSLAPCDDACCRLMAAALSSLYFAVSTYGQQYVCLYLDNSYCTMQRKSNREPQVFITDLSRHEAPTLVLVLLLHDGSILDLCLLPHHVLLGSAGMSVVFSFSMRVLDAVYFTSPGATCTQPEPIDEDFASLLLLTLITKLIHQYTHHSQQNQVLGKSTNLRTLRT
jgi:hypothetical protein